MFNDIFSLLDVLEDPDTIKIINFFNDGIDGANFTQLNRKLEISRLKIKKILKKMKKFSVLKVKCCKHHKGTQKLVERDKNYNLMISFLNRKAY